MNDLYPPTQALSLLRSGVGKVEEYQGQKLLIIGNKFDWLLDRNGNRYLYVVAAAVPFGEGDLRRPLASDIFPRHQASMHLEHNPHLAYYQTAADRIAEWDETGNGPDWKDEEAKQRSIDTNEIWELQWYPHTPISSYAICAPTFAELLVFAREVEGQE